MNANNTVVLTGRLTRDPQLRRRSRRVADGRGRFAGWS
jgi:single-stranded DNA-binding protein